MRIIKTILAITCIISCSSKTEENTNCNGKFDSNKLGIAFNHPENWNIAEYPNDGLIEIAYHNIVVNRTAKSNRAFNISIQLISTKFDKNELYALFEQRYVKVLEQMEGLIVHEKQSEIREINNSEWKLVSFYFEHPNEEPHHFKLKHFIHFNDPYSVMMSISVQDLNDKKIPEEIDCFLESLTIK